MSKKKKARGLLPSLNYRRQVYVGKRADGTKRYVTFTAETPAGADALASEFKLRARRLIREGVAVDDIPREDVPVKRTDTVEHYIAQYIDTGRATGLSPSTLLGYRRIAKRAYNTLKNRSIDALTLDMVQQYINQQAMRGLSSKSIRNELSILSCALRNVRPDLNLRQIRLPRRTKSEMQIPSNEQITRLLDAANNTPLYIPLLLASMCGLRRSEICALSWADINLKSRTIHIHAAEVKNEDNGFSIKGTKTAAGDRVIHIPSTVAAELARTRTLSPRVTELTPDAITRRYERLLDRLTDEKHPRIPGRFHDLRHYHASVMVAVGAPDKYISADMGHASMEMVRRVYGHVMHDRQQSINEQMESHADAIFGQIQHERQHEAE